MDIRAAKLASNPPPDRRRIYEWAADNVDIPACLPRHGRFDVSTSRHFIAVFDALQDDHARQIVVRKPLRGGGTLISDVWHCWSRSVDPGPQMAVFQSDEISNQHAEARLMPMMLSSNRGILPRDKDKQRKDEIIFSDGLPLYVTGPALNKLQTKAIRYMSLDELWLYKAGIFQEAEGRLGDFLRMGTSKLLVISQAGNPDDDVDNAANAGDLNDWQVQCAGCGAYHTPTWNGTRSDGSKFGMRWDVHKDDHGHWLVDRCLASVRYECGACGHVHLDTSKTKTDWNLTGRYERTRPDALPRNRSFRWNAIIDFPWVDLTSYYLQGLNAYRKGSPEALVAFWQKRMVSPKDDASLSDSTIDFKLAPIELAGGLPGEKTRMVTVDRQTLGVHWVTCRSWDATGKSLRLGFRQCHGEAEVEAFADEFKSPFVLVDYGYDSDGDTGVFAWCARNDKPEQKWIAVHGIPKREFVHTIGKVHVTRSYSPVAFRDPEEGKGIARKPVAYFTFSSDLMSDRLDNLIRMGIWLEPTRDPHDPVEIEYRKQMTAEDKRERLNKTTGRREFMWYRKRRENHAWDCGKMQCLAATIMDLLPDAYQDIPSEAQTASA